MPADRAGSGFGSSSKGTGSPGWCLVPALAAIAVFAGSLANGLTLDDVPLVRDNPSIRDLSDLPALFVSPYWDVPREDYGLYRPLAVVSLAINRALSGADPAGFHAGNVLLHALAASLAWVAARRAGTRYGTALAAALLFAVHPIRVEAVANVAGRAEILAALGVLTAWIAHRRAAESEAGGRLRWSLAAATAWLAAILSKEVAILAPAVFGVDDLLRRRTGEARAGTPALWTPEIGQNSH